MVRTYQPEMSWAASQRYIRDRHWGQLERLVNRLPSAFVEPFRLLQFDLALRYSASGRFRDIFLGTEWVPIPWIAGWLCVDSGAEQTEEELDRLFVVSVLMAARVELVTGLQDEGSFAAADQLSLALYLSERVAAEVTELTGGPHWLDHHSGRASDHPTPAEGTTSMSAGSPWAQPMRLLAAACSAVRRLTLPPDRLDEMIDLIAGGFALRDQLATLHADLLRGHVTFPIELIARNAGLSLQPWPPAEVLLGAMVLTGSAPAVLQESHRRLCLARAVADELALPTVASFLDGVAADVSGQLARLAGTAAGPARQAKTPARQPPLIRRAVPAVTAAIGMARGFLLADPSFREACEVHREGMFGQGEVVSRFPVGLILEILAAHGHPFETPIADFLDSVIGNGFRYYDHPLSDVDTDTVGVFLRLLRHTGEPRPRLAAAGAVLARLEQQVEQLEAVPVWLPDPDRPDGLPVLNLGEDCGTVAAHLLLGLCALDDGAHQRPLRVGTTNLLDRIRTVGLAANVNYPRPFALAAYLRLIDRVRDRAGLAEPAAAADAVLRPELERLAAPPVRSAQQAALLTRACLDAGRTELLRPGWRKTMLEQQRFDGSWAGEGFAAAPNRGAAVTWYASTTMTTALVFDALARWHAAGA